MSSTILRGTKGQTLKMVRDKVSLFRVPDFFVFESVAFQSNPDVVLEKIVNWFDCKELVVRSSVSDEDGAETSMAGE